MNLNVFKAIVSASDISISEENGVMRLSRSAWAYCYGVLDVDGYFVYRPDFGQEVDEVWDILKGLGISLKEELTYEMAKKLVVGGYTIRAANDMAASMGGVDCTINDLHHLDHFEESNKDNFGPCAIYYYL